MKIRYFLCHKNSRKDLRKANRTGRVQCIQTAVEIEKNMCLY